jgi:hypothetical protein
MGPTGGELKLFEEWEEKYMEMRGIAGRKRWIIGMLLGGLGDANRAIRGEVMQEDMC